MTWPHSTISRLTFTHGCYAPVTLQTAAHAAAAVFTFHTTNLCYTACTVNTAGLTCTRGMQQESQDTHGKTGRKIAHERCCTRKQALYIQMLLGSSSLCWPVYSAELLIYYREKAISSLCKCQSSNTAKITILYIILPSVCLSALTLYPATDCAAATDISGVSGRCQLSR